MYLLGDADSIGRAPDTRTTCGGFAVWLPVGARLPLFPLGLAAELVFHTHTVIVLTYDTAHFLDGPNAYMGGRRVDAGLSWEGVYHAGLPTYADLPQHPDARDRRYGTRSTILTSQSAPLGGTASWAIQPWPTIGSRLTHRSTAKGEP